MPRQQSRVITQSITWEDFATVKEWKKSLKQDADFGELSSNTVIAIKYWFPTFLESTKTQQDPEGKTPDELIEEALVNPKIIKQRLSDCFSWSKKNLPTRDYNSITLGVYGVCRGFYSHNMPAMPKIRTPKLLPRQVHKTDNNFPLTKIVEADMGNGIKTKTLELNRDFFKEELLSKLSLRDQAITLISISGGMDIGDSLGLNMDLLRNQEQFERIFVNDHRSKTGEIINTFWSKEATKLVRKYARLERKNSQNSDPIFVSSIKTRRILFKQKYGREPKIDDYDSLPVKRFNAKQYSKNLRKVADKLGVSLEKNKQSPYRPKRWRKLFSDACDNAKIGDNKRKIFMGKADRSDKVYSGQARHELEIYYEMVEPHVTIYSHEQGGDFIKLQKEYDDKLQKIQSDQDELKLKQQRHEIANQIKIEELEKKLENSDR